MSIRPQRITANERCARAVHSVAQNEGVEKVATIGNIGQISNTAVIGAAETCRLSSILTPLPSVGVRANCSPAPGHQSKSYTRGTTMMADTLKFKYLSPSGPIVFRRTFQPDLPLPNHRRMSDRYSRSACQISLVGAAIGTSSADASPMVFLLLSIEPEQTKNAASPAQFSLLRHSVNVIGISRSRSSLCYALKYRLKLKTFIMTYDDRKPKPAVVSKTEHHALVSIVAWYCSCAIQSRKKSRIPDGS